MKRREKELEQKIYDSYINETISLTSEKVKENDRKIGCLDMVKPNCC